MFPSRETSSLHENRFGIGKWSVIRSTWTWQWLLVEAASRAASSCKCIWATSLDDLPDLLHGSFTAMRSILGFRGTWIWGREGQEGTFNSSSSSIHSGYSDSHVMFSGTCFRCRTTCSVSGISCFHWSISFSSKFRSAIPLNSSLWFSFSIILEICPHLMFREDAYRESLARLCTVWVFRELELGALQAFQVKSKWTKEQKQDHVFYLHS